VVKTFPCGLMWLEGEPIQFYCRMGRIEEE